MKRSIVVFAILLAQPALADSACSLARQSLAEMEELCAQDAGYCALRDSIADIERDTCASDHGNAETGYTMGGGSLQPNGSPPVWDGMPGLSSGDPGDISDPYLGSSPSFQAGNGQSAKSEGGSTSATCNLVDDHGRDCISLDGNESEIRFGWTHYKLTFGNRCENSISVRANYKNDSRAGTVVVPPGGTGEITCYDTETKKLCGGFDSWSAKC